MLSYDGTTRRGLYATEKILAPRNSPAISFAQAEFGKKYDRTDKLSGPVHTQILEIRPD
jgi:hypothetical protein